MRKQRVKVRVSIVGEEKEGGGQEEEGGECRI
jgi:hypothetical protein